MKVEPAASHWQVLLEQSQRIIAETNKNGLVIAHWTFGGGTALMLQIRHRESYDIDLFLDDPQIIGYLRASAVKLDFSIGVPSYSGDGSSHFRIVFPNYGEIDFIVAAELTATPYKNTLISDNHIKLETVEEIIAKKVRFRGAMIQPRDVFDIAAACHAG